MIRIEGTEQVALVSWSEAHIHQLYPLANNPKIAMNLRDSFPQPYTVHDARAWVESNQKFNPPRNLAIEWQGKLAGGVGCELGKDELRVNAELGFWIGEPFWGKGIATQSVSLFTTYIFGGTEVRRIFAQVFDFNGQSMHVLEKAGYEPEAILKDAYCKRGIIGDLFQYVKIKGEV